MKTIKNITYLAFALFAFACIAFSPQARAVCQEGCGTGDFNTFLGEDALLNNTTGTFNTAVGFNALFANTTGDDNTAVGHNALSSNTTGQFNTAVGWAALSANVAGGGNTAVGDGALEVNTTGSSNTAVGNDALFFNTTGLFNTATGVGALQFSIDGSNNTACGFFASQIGRHGSNNTAIGYQALRNNNQGADNTALGTNALDNCTGSNNIAIGSSAGTRIKKADNNIAIANVGVPHESNTIRVGNETHTNTFIAGINGVTVAGGVGVVIDATGHLGTATSSARYKNDIKPMDKASEAILALKPVTFRYKHDIDPDGIPQFGLVAEEVAKVNPDLVSRDEQGKPYTVRYEAVNAMLLNEFLKEHRTVQEQAATITQLKAELQATAMRQQKQIDALTATVQKVSAQLELSKPATQTVLNSH